MGFGDFLSNDTYNDFVDSSYLLDKYQQQAITGKNVDYNYEYDRFPKNFIYSKNIGGVPSNPRASGFDKLHTEAFITNKVRNIEKVYLGSNEMPEELERMVLPQNQGYLSSNKPCSCNKCNSSIDTEYSRKSNINTAIEELQKRNDILTLLLVFIVIYCLVQLLYPSQQGYTVIQPKSIVSEEIKVENDKKSL
jgi:hypothetical protein